MKVYVAEKAKLGKAIAAQLMKMSPVVDSGREFVAGKDWAVCWASGHILEQEEPDFYIGRKYPDARKNGKGRFVWTFDHLPLVPGSNDWAIHVVADKSSLFNTIKKFVGKATVVVNAGDPDREGQLLIDEILETLGNKKPVRRVLIPAFDEVTVTNGFKNERDNSEFRGMRDAALARSRADWLCGMNFSRAVTLQAQANGYPETISIGRVQTPLLGLIVQRYLEIERFKPVDYFTVVAKMKVAKGEFLARWKPHEGQVGLDEEGRLLDRRLADQLNTLVTGKAGKIVEYSDEEKQEGPPLPFSVGRLQITMSKQYGYKSEDVLKAAQSLYDQKLTTYPRSDCQYLPVAQLADAPMVLAAVRGSLSFGDAVVDQIDPTRKSRAWNDDKVSAHHAIIPTTERANLSSLSPIERHVYEAVCKRYVAQFMPKRTYREVSATVDVCGQRFVATGTTTIKPGWKAIYGDSADDGDEAKGDDAILPPMKQGDSADCLGLNITAKKTAPPKLFTDATLLEAMINIHKFVTDEKIKGIFMKMRADKVGDDEGGLGTPATRHTFVPKLIEIGVVIRVEPEGKGGKKAKESFLKPTDAGVALIGALPPELGRPDMTALWEASMDEIEAGRATVDRFLEMQANYIGKTIEKVRAEPLTLPAPPTAAKKKSFGGGSNSGPRTPAEPAGKDCPECGAPLVKRKNDRGPFLGCSAYPKCKHLENVS